MKNNLVLVFPYLLIALCAAGCLPDPPEIQPTQAMPNDILAVNARSSVIFRPDAPNNRLQLGPMFSLVAPNSCEILGDAIFSSGQLWLACSGSSTVVALDPATFQATATHYLPESSNPLALAKSGEEYLFVSLFQIDRIFRQAPGEDFKPFFDLKALDLQSDPNLGQAYPRPQGIAVHNDNLLITIANLAYANIGETLASSPAGPGYLAVLDVESATLKALTPLSGKNATKVKSTDHGIFVTQLGHCDEFGCSGGGISRVDPESFEETAFHPMTHAPYSFDLAADSGDLYVANAEGVSVVDASTLEPKDYAAFPERLCGRASPLPISYYLSDLVTTDSFVYTLEYNHRCLIQMDRQTLSFTEHQLASQYTSLVRVPAVDNP